MSDSNRQQWRSLEEATGEAGDARLEAEFPFLASFDDVSRRSFLRAMGASLALTGLAGCGETPGEAVPYVRAPEHAVPGKPSFYATAVPFEGWAQPVLGECHDGRPTRLTGNPDHPEARGAVDVFAQAAVLQLYDPERSRAPRFMGREASWDAFETAAANLLPELQESAGEGTRILTGNVTSPTLLRQLAEFERRYPKSRWHAHEAVGRGTGREAAELAFGRPLDVHPRLEQADVVVSIGDDFLGPGIRQATFSRRWAERRRGDAAAIRLHVAEPTPTLTGAAADARLRVRPSRLPDLMLGLAGALGRTGAARIESLTASEHAWVEAAAGALDAARGRSLVLGGPTLSPEVQAVAHVLNDRLGNLGKTVLLTEPVGGTPPDGPRSLEALARDMAAGEVERLFVLEANPAYASPADLDFARLMDEVPLRIHAGLYYDETAARCHWHVPTSHALEGWSDLRSPEGTATVVQPLVSSFFSVRSIHEIFALLSGRIPAPDALEIVKATWRTGSGEEAFERGWRRALYLGYVPESAPPGVEASAGAVEVDPAPVEQSGLEAVIQPDPTVWDGRFANVSWLQELPKPLTKLTWDNVILLPPGLAASMGISTEDMVEVREGGRTLSGAAWVMPGQPDHTLTLFLGYGRERAGSVGSAAGYNAFRLLRSDAPRHLAHVEILKSGSRVKLATTQRHHGMEGFEFVKTVAPGHAAGKEGEPRSLYPEWQYGDPSWGMVIDLDVCTGCNACMIACQAENNVPVVGREQVAMGREMHWLRVDTYFSGTPEEPEILFQPVPCMHCEKAPCEMGCPVNATVHGPEGLNQMIYNRCIGTRTCSSFCPYKVRRFNWFDYTGGAAPSVEAQRNPDVTVRDRGVMEKCTYCVQRISAAHIAARKERREIREGEVVTACQEACPTSAIVFGNIADPASAVSLRKREERNYALLEELNTRPRTTYLARIERPRPAVGGKGS